MCSLCVYLCKRFFILDFSKGQAVLRVIICGLIVFSLGSMVMVGGVRKGLGNATVHLRVSDILLWAEEILARWWSGHSFQSRAFCLNKIKVHSGILFFCLG